MRQETFATVVEAGHMGLVYIQIPFDPSVAWDVRPRHFVQGRLNGCPFQGEVGFRRRKFYMLLDEDLQRVAKLSPGDAVEVVIEPREPGEAELSSDARLALDPPGQWGGTGPEEEGGCEEGPEQEEDRRSRHEEASDAQASIVPRPTRKRAPQ